MEPSAVLPAPAALGLGVEAARRHRAELRESISALEQALAAPAPRGSDAWCERVHAALVELSADLRVHIDITVGADGLYSGVVASNPRLSHAVSQLSSDQAQTIRFLESLLSSLDCPGPEGIPPERVRQLGAVLLGRLIRLRQRGADLVYEAYATDIGGEN
jgi:hypothetical protein